MTSTRFKDEMQRKEEAKLKKQITESAKRKITVKTGIGNKRTLAAREKNEDGVCSVCKVFGVF